jgi:hypothetical protein
VVRIEQFEEKVMRLENPREIVYILVAMNIGVFLVFFVEAPVLGVKVNWISILLFNLTLVTTYLITSIWRGDRKGILSSFTLGFGLSFFVPGTAGSIIALMSFGGIMGSLGVGIFSKE